jgi:hypothetical protein
MDSGRVEVKETGTYEVVATEPEKPVRPGAYYEWLRAFTEKHPGTYEVEHPFPDHRNRRYRRWLGNYRGWSRSRLGQARRTND